MDIIVQNDYCEQAEGRILQAMLSPKQLAEVVGVSESSLKRWADQGELAVVRTAGGHRRIPVAEAVRFARARRLPILRPAVLGLPELQAGRARETDDAERLGELLYEHLKRGEAEPVRGTVVELYLAGRSVAWICDGPIQQAMRRIGELYHHSSTGIYTEHRATDICLHTLNLLRALIRPASSSPLVQASAETSSEAETTAPLRAIGAAGPHDPYQIPTLMAACVLQEVGFETVNLGPDLPLQALAEAADEYQAKLVWLACSVPSAAPTPAEVTDLVQRLNHQDAALALGGRGLAGLDLPDPPNMHLCQSMGEMAAYARGLVA
jgi:excisionase family DNA binding protein